MKYILLGTLMWLMSGLMHHLDGWFDTIDDIVQDFLSTLFELLAQIITVVGIIRLFPQDFYSNRRTWFYYIGITGGLAGLHTLMRLIEIAGRLLR